MASFLDEGSPGEPEETAMNRSTLSIAATMMVLAAARGDAIPSGMTPRLLAESIPPNCTLDPFTHKMNCHVWPAPKSSGSSAVVRA
jgi:hypothetical protein